jgi:hypothetical protein
MKAPDLDNDTCLVPEIIVDFLECSKEEKTYLCERARFFWTKNEGFRKSFRRKDHREVLMMWFRHWLEGKRKQKPLDKSTILLDNKS